MSSRRLPGFALALVLFLLLAAQTYGQQTVEKSGSGRFVEVKISAPSLEGNLLNDPAEQPVTIYLPPSYDRSPERRYPAIYLLHGFNGTNRTWTIDGGYGFNIQPVLDSLIAEGRIREMIVVAPNGRNAYKFSFFVNSAVTGNWEDFILRDVVGYVDKNFRTLARAASRGIAGHSGGGYGAIYLGMRHPDVFGAVYALAPCCLTGGTEELNPIQERAWKRVGRLASREELPQARLSAPEDFFINFDLASSAAFSPNPERPALFADYLFEEREGGLVKNQAAFAKWQEKAPLHLLDTCRENLLSLRGIYLDFGQLESPFIRTGVTLFSKALADGAIPHTLEIYVGGDHVNKVKERLGRRVFPFFSETLDCSAP